MNFHFHQPILNHTSFLKTNTNDSFYNFSTGPHNGLFLNNDMSTANTLDSTYNIFINSTLYETYSSYLSTTVLPLLGFLSLPFAPLSDTSILEPLTAGTTTFSHSYTYPLNTYGSSNSPQGYDHPLLISHHRGVLSSPTISFITNCPMNS